MGNLPTKEPMKSLRKSKSLMDRLVNNGSKN